MTTAPAVASTAAATIAKKRVLVVMPFAMSPENLALRQAQLEVQKRRKFAHPFFWAPFNVIGNGRMQLGS